ncbi:MULTISPECIES: hypothetical protein [Bacillaceae]|uniref:hypothetical protein n=1 Tax=Bacillaceae TaxID=186817 RepID=UPI000660B0E4|nr:MULTISPECIES: hypothetical protein [Bacillaceae]MCF7620913.1 hypothetical protein [Peribacillus frigoritolerans]PRA87636.1 hypothetical protein CQ056_14275 [Peribacillus simplex]
MGLFKGDAVKHVNKVLDKVEKRREKLTERVATLHEEARLMYQAVQDDFNQAILEDKEPTKKLSTDLEKVRAELKQAEFQLSQLDGVLKSELEKQRDAIDQERNDFTKDKREDFNKLFDEMNELKIAYLNKIIEYKEKKAKYDSEYWKTFREVEKRVGLKNKDPRYDFQLHLNQRYQMDGHHYSPLVYMDEIREAFVDRKVSSVTMKNKDKFKK